MSRGARRPGGGSPPPPGEAACCSVRARLAGPAAILLAALLATAPQLVRGNSCGHDFDFHLVSWFDALAAWRAGVVYPHWAPSPNFGAGEPRLLFYPPLSWMLGAALGALMPWSAVPVAITLLVLASAGLATRALARQALGRGAATLAGCAAVFSPYGLYTLYERSDFGEALGGLWIPLLLLLILRDRPPEPRAPQAGPGPWRRGLDGSAWLLALVVAGAWLSNAPLGVMASYLLALVAAARALTLRSWAPVIRASAGVAGGLALAAFYLVPAALEQRWVDMRQILDDPGSRIENNWLFSVHANPLLALHDQELRRASVVAAAMLATGLAALAVCRLRRITSRDRSWWISLGVILPVVALLELPLSAPLWNLLPRLRFLQFPWRWMVAVEAPLGIFLAGAAWVERRRLLVTASFAAVFLGASAAAAFELFQPCDEEDAVGAMATAYRGGDGFPGTDEYEPPWADSTMVATGLPGACWTTDATVILGRGGTGDTNPDWDPGQGECARTYPLAGTPGRQLEVAGTAAEDGFLVLRLRSYPAWRVEVNGRVLPVPETESTPGDSLPRREDGLLAVPVQRGPFRVTAAWTTTPGVAGGRWLSLLGLLLVAALCLLERRFHSALGYHEGNADRRNIPDPGRRGAYR